MLESRVARTWRGVSAAGVATFAAVVSHSVADRAPAPAIGVLLTLIVAVPVCVALAGARLSWIRLGIAVTLSQFAFHGLLLIGVADPSGSTASPAGTGEHLHDSAAMAAALAGTATPAPLAHSGVAMWIAHAFAALLTVLAIGRGEKALRALLDLSGWTFATRMLDRQPLAVVRRRAAVAPETTTAFLSAVLLSALRRRGPPVTA